MADQLTDNPACVLCWLRDRRVVEPTHYVAPGWYCDDHAPEARTWQRWPLRYRLAHRLHSHINRLHRYSGTRWSWWLNDRLGRLWIPWWIGRGKDGG